MCVRTPTLGPDYVYTLVHDVDQRFATDLLARVGRRRWRIHSYQQLATLCVVVKSYGEPAVPVVVGPFHAPASQC